MTQVDAPERVPDWLLGGRVRRRVLERLAGPKAWSARELSTEIPAGEATVFELFRALKAIEALDHKGNGRYQLGRRSTVARAIRALLKAATPLEDDPVDRPPSRLKP